MNSIVRINVKDTVKNPTYFFMFLMVCILSVNSILQMAKVYPISSDLSFMVVFTYLVLNVSIFSFLALVTNQAIVISEKVSGRCEYYLANRANVWTLVKAYSRSTFALCMMPIILFNLLILVIAYFDDIEVLLQLLIDLRYALFFIVFILFTCCVTIFLTVLAMVSRKPERIRFYLSLSSFAIIYATILPMRLFINKGYMFDSVSIIYCITFTLLLIGCIFALFLYLMSKRLTNETVVLSYKQ